MILTIYQSYISHAMIHRLSIDYPNPQWKIPYGKTHTHIYIYIYIHFPGQIPMETHPSVRRSGQPLPGRRTLPGSVLGLDQTSDTRSAVTRCDKSFQMRTYGAGIFAYI